jgi:hypothetical protein
MSRADLRYAGESFFGAMRERFQRIEAKEI